MGPESLLSESTFIGLLSILLPFISFIIGIYILLLGVWELRVAESRSKYTNFMFYGILFTFIVPIVMNVFIRTLFVL